MFIVVGSTSTKTGCAPRWMMTLTVEAKVIGVVMTSSPTPTPRTSRARWIPAVQEFKASAWLHPTYALNCSSNRCVLGPVPNHPDRSVSTTSSISASRMSGLPNTRKLSRLAGLADLSSPRFTVDGRLLCSSTGLYVAGTGTPSPLTLCRPREMEMRVRTACRASNYGLGLYHTTPFREIVTGPGHATLQRSVQRCDLR